MQDDGRAVYTQHTAAYRRAARIYVRRMQTDRYDSTLLLHFSPSDRHYIQDATK
jgi:hypothetical protein